MQEGQFLGVMPTLDDELAYINRLRSVTPEQIRVAARRYFDLQRYTRLALMPERP